MLVGLLPGTSCNVLSSLFVPSIYPLAFLLALFPSIFPSIYNILHESIVSRGVASHGHLVKVAVGQSIWFLFPLWQGCLTFLVQGPHCNAFVAKRANIPGVSGGAKQKGGPSPRKIFEICLQSTAF
jgi:hypothetical protein